MKIRGYKTYLRILILLTIIGMFFSVLRLYGSLNFIRFYLLLLLLNNTWFVVFNLDKIRLRLWSLLLIVLIGISFFIGLLYNNISDRTILDLYKPISFILVFHLFSKLEIRRIEIEQGVKKASIILFKASIVFAILSFVLLSILGGYAGVRLPIVLPMAYYATNQKKMKVFILVIAIFLSGKRAILVALLPVLFIGFKFKITLKKITILSVIFLFSYIIISANWDKLKRTSGFSKFTYTIESTALYFETYDLQILNNVSGRRLQEVISGLYDFSITDWAFGKGVGYTYNVYSIDRKIIDQRDKANIHFSPASLIASYGFIFMIIFYSIFIRHIRLGFKYSKRYNNKTLMILSLFCVAILIESFFAYVLFVIPLIPVVMGLISNEIKYLKSESWDV